MRAGGVVLPDGRGETPKRENKKKNRKQKSWMQI
jgi:hypothetical protein